MRCHALVVDDAPDILDDVKDRLESLGHTCDCVTSQNDARECIRKCQYSFILLDLEIPVQYGRPPRIQNGQNLLKEIRGTKGFEHTQIIVITAYGHDSPDLATEVLRGGGAGANDFINKPFPGSGHTLEKAVRDALARDAARRRKPAGTAKGSPSPKPEPRPFTRGEMVFYPDRVELCRVKILGDSGLGHSRRMLELLRKKKEEGRFVRMSGEKLAGEIEPENGINSITGCAKTLRSNIRKRLKRDLNLECDEHDVLVRDDQGYHLNDEKIMVRDGEEEEEPAVGTAGDESGLPSLNERQEWILEQTGEGREVTRRMLEDEFEVSDKTAKRDFQELVKRGLIEFVRTRHPGFYRRKT